MMKSVAAFVMILGYFVSPLAEAQEKLKDLLPPCFLAAKRETENCQTSKKCSTAKINEKLKTCVSKLKLKPDLCNYQRCWFSDANATFPQTKGCQFRIESTSHGEEIEALLSSKEKSKRECVVDNFTLGKIELRVEESTLQPNKTWHFATAMLPLNFEKVVTPKQIEPVEFEDMKYVIAAVSAGFYCDVSKADEVLPNANNKKSVRYDDCPSRHFTGRKGPAEFSFISKFKLKEKVQICGVQLMSGTQLRFRMDGQTNSAPEDGAVALTGFSPEQFPNLKRKWASDSANTAIICRPGANLNWKDCSCAYGMSDADFDSME